ncbi:MAG: hypothetical protein HRT35_15115 [Algicola sp.]|nr:hypothetical protein [Algicola sp.]
MMYQLAGSINTIMIFVSLLGVFAQLKLVWQRQKDAQLKPDIGRPTELLSLNQFSVSFLAYFSFFVYGYSITPFNHFIVWPRLVASLLLMWILFEILRDRKTRATKVVFGLSIACLLAGLVGLIFNQQIDASGKTISTALIVTITAFLAQGYYHQIKLIIQHRQTGAVSIRMSQFILLMDLSTIAFALTMPLGDSWPLMLLAVVSGITKLVIMYLFRWVRLGAGVRAG